MPARLDWPSAVGNFLLNFGTLDYLIFEYLEAHQTPEDFQKTKRLHFKDRLSRLEQCLAAQQNPEAAQLFFADFLHRLEPIRNLRNHLAHGTMLVRFAEDREPVLEISLPAELDAWASPESRHVKFDELVVALGALTNLIDEFRRLAI